MPGIGKWTLSVLTVAVLILISAPLARAVEYGPVTTETEFFNALTMASGSDNADTILVAAGTYDFSNTTIIYNNPNTGNLTIAGAGETLTIFDGGGVNQIININLGSGPGNTTLVILRDLTFQNGSSPTTGGAAYINTFSQNLNVDRVRFLENVSVNRGAGFYFSTTTGDLEVKSSWFFSNHTTGGTQTEGGGFYSFSGSTGSVVVEESDFEKNYSNAQSGGGAYAITSNGTISVKRCSFTENNALAGLGGGLYASVPGPSGWAEVENCLFTANSAALGAGLNLAATDGPLSVVNVTAVSNSSTNGAGAMYASLYNDTASLEIYNSIFYDNTIGGGAGQDIYVVADGDNNETHSAVTVQYNNIDIKNLFVVDSDNLTETSNIDVNPLLDSGYMLSAGSSCIDAGNSTLVGDSLDLAGNDRIVDDPATVDTGVGIPAVDMGAFEFQPPSSGGGGGGGCSTAGPAPGEPVWPEIFWIVVLGGVFILLRRQKVKS